MNTIGDMPMPEDFRYRKIMNRGKPKHRKFDDFWMRHPTMDIGHRAKIFSPYDALKGFSDAVASKEVVYVDRIELNSEDEQELNERLGLLHELTCNSRLARENNVAACVLYYEPCSDINNFAYGLQGQYKMISGQVKRVDAHITQTIQIDDTVICVEDIAAITGEVFGDKVEDE